MDTKDEIIKYWKKSPFLAKVIWVVSVILASSSIASLSETVFAWKGFILDGVEFYRELLEPLKILLSSVFQADVTGEQADLIVCLGIFISAHRKFITHRWLTPDLE